MTGNNTITEDLFLFHSKVGAPVSHELIVFNEGALIEEQLDSFSGCELPILVLFLDSLLSSSNLSLGLVGFPLFHERSSHGLNNHSSNLQQR